MAAAAAAAPPVPAPTTTQQWKISFEPEQAFLDLLDQVAPAGDLLAQNQVVGFPTETVYGLGGNALSDEAVSRIYRAKGRPSDNPLIVHVSTVEQARALVTAWPRLAELLATEFWPGPLTMILPHAGDRLSRLATAGLGTVGLRIPDHPVARALIHCCGLPIAAPSANLSGKPSPTRAAHVYADLEGRIAGIVDGGSAGIGVESTVVDLSGFCGDPPAGDGPAAAAAAPPRQLPILRPGGVTMEMLQELCDRELGSGAVEVVDLSGEGRDGGEADPRVAVAAEAEAKQQEQSRLQQQQQQQPPQKELAHHLEELEQKQQPLEAERERAGPKAPGMKYIHYSPAAPVVLLDGSPAWIHRTIQQQLAEHPSGFRVGVLGMQGLLDSGLFTAPNHPAPAGVAPAHPECEPIGVAHLLGCGSDEDPLAVAQMLFHNLREFDLLQPPVDMIFVQAVSKAGLGRAVMNRLLKASSRMDAELPQ